jgi:phenylacetate-CoA ligase
MSASIHDVRTPLLRPEGEAMLRRLQQHPDAPRFNYATGDRLHAADLSAVDRYREELGARRGARAAAPSADVLARVDRLRRTVPHYREWIGPDVDLDASWPAVPTTSRRDLALAPWDFVPDDEPVDRLVIYRTAGTTGHPISVPHHPLAVRLYEPMIELALARHGARLEPTPDAAACFLIGAQIRTYTYATVLYTWNGAGFAKLNLRPTEWPRDGAQRRYVAEFAPQLLTGDPISFAEMMRMEVESAPRALVTTSVAMSPALKTKLAERYRAPVIDWYSMVETGPVGYACPLGGSYHVLPHDIHVEVVDDLGAPLAPGTRGEIAITGGRNPFAPLVRYRTGDYGKLELAPCDCGDSMPRLVELEGRAPVLLRAFDGTPVSTVDLSRLLREFPLLLHELVQRADRAIELAVRPLPDAALDLEAIREALRRVVGDVTLRIEIDPALGERTDAKASPYRSELMVED